MRTLKLVIEYDGRHYRGWQRQKNGLSIQEVLEGKMAVITGEQPKVIGSGRTDAGVHALGQVAHVRIASAIPLKSLCNGLNSLLPEDIAIVGIEEVRKDFHARIDARSKTYLYRICNRPTRSPLLRCHAWSVYKPLDRQAMAEAAGYLVGTHDFRSFSTVHTEVKTFVRTILHLDVEGASGGMIDISVEADGFLRYMVRTVVGTLVEVGKGRRQPEGMTAILQACNRDAAGMTAPAHGLYLKEVQY